MRKLVTAQTIKDLDPIPGKDRIRYASFQNSGFRAIVGDTYQVGDRVVYCEADSILPVKPEFEFLRKRCYSPRWDGFVIRNMRMGGVYSEGIVFPWSILPPNSPVELRDGTDLTETLGVRKYDPEALEEAKSVTPPKPQAWWIRSACRFKVVRRLCQLLSPAESYAWPRWASKSDETRAQSLPYIFEAYRGQQFVATEKLDGQSCLYGIVDKRFWVCSRNLCLKSHKRGGARTNHWEYALEAGVEAAMHRIRAELGEDFYVQGELVGPGIQGNKYGLPRKRFFVFNFRLVKSGRYLPYEQMRLLATNVGGLDCVPLVDGEITWSFSAMPELLEYARGYSTLGKSVVREGVVLRSKEVNAPDHGQSNMRSFKIINPDFDVLHSKR